MQVDPYVVLGSAVVGFLVGLTGAGGGALMTPMLILLFGPRLRLVVPYSSGISSSVSPSPSLSAACRPSSLAPSCRRAHPIATSGPQSPSLSLPPD